MLRLNATWQPDLTILRWSLRPGGSCWLKTKTANLEVNKIAHHYTQMGDETSPPKVLVTTFPFRVCNMSPCVSECLQSQGGDLILDPSLPNGSLRNALALPPLGVLPPCPPIPPQAKSRVFAIILYAEFLKELAAIAQEHSIALDCSAEE